MDFVPSARWKERLFADWGWSCPEEDLKTRLDPADSDLALKIWLKRWKGSQLFRCLLHRGEHHPTKHTGLQTALWGTKQSRKAYSGSRHPGIWRAGKRWKVAGVETFSKELGSTAESGMEVLGPSTTQLNSRGIPWEKKNWGQCHGMHAECISPAAAVPAGGDWVHAAAGWLFSRNRLANSEPANSLLTWE